MTRVHQSQKITRRCLVPRPAIHRRARIPLGTLDPPGEAAGLY